MARVAKLKVRERWHRTTKPHTPRGGLLYDRRGVAAMEFAICGTAFIALLVACAQTALVFFAQQGIQTSAETVARSVMTGQAQTAKMTKNQFAAAACASLPSYMNCSKLFVDVRTASSFANLDTSVPTLTYDANGNVTNPWQFDTGSGSAIVILRLMYVWPVSPGPLGFTLSNQGSSNNRLLIGTMVFKSEPFA